MIFVSETTLFIAVVLTQLLGLASLAEHPTGAAPQSPPAVPAAVLRIARNCGRHDNDLASVSSQWLARMRHYPVRHGRWRHV